MGGYGRLAVALYAAGGLQRKDGVLQGLVAAGGNGGVGGVILYWLE